LIPKGGRILLIGFVQMLQEGLVSPVLEICFSPVNRGKTSFSFPPAMPNHPVPVPRAILMQPGKAPV